MVGILEIDKLVVWILCSVLAMNIACAEISVNISSADNFEVGDRIEFNYSIISDENVTVFFTPKVECPAVTQPNLFSGPVNLTANEAFNAEFKYITVSGDFYSQTCQEIIEITQPIEKVTIKKINITTPPSIILELKTCKDKNCLTESRVFPKGENVYLDYDATSSDLVLDSILVLPDGTIKTLSLPTNIAVNQLGIYRLMVNASKIGYRPSSKSIEFSAIEKELNLPYIQECNLNFICEGNENFNTCPEDCKPGAKVIEAPQEKKQNVTVNETKSKEVAPKAPVEGLGRRLVNRLVWIAVIAVIVIIAFIIFSKRKQKELP